MNSPLSLLEKGVGDLPREGVLLTFEVVLIIVNCTYKYFNREKPYLCYCRSLYLYVQVLRTLIFLLNHILSAETVTPKAQIGFSVCGHFSKGWSDRLIAREASGCLHSCSVISH